MPGRKPGSALVSCRGRTEEGNGVGCYGDVAEEAVVARHGTDLNGNVLKVSHAPPHLLVRFVGKSKQKIPEGNVSTCTLVQQIQLRACRKITFTA